VECGINNNEFEAEVEENDIKKNDIKKIEEKNNQYLNRNEGIKHMKTKFYLYKRFRVLINKSGIL
jgi:hypothetical protein